MPAVMPATISVRTQPIIICRHQPVGERPDIDRHQLDAGASIRSRLSRSAGVADIQLSHGDTRDTAPPDTSSSQLSTLQEACLKGCVDPKQSPLVQNPGVPSPVGITLNSSFRLRALPPLPSQSPMATMLPVSVCTQYLPEVRP